MPDVNFFASSSLLPAICPKTAIFAYGVGHSWARGAAANAGSVRSMNDLEALHSRTTVIDAKASTGLFGAITSGRECAAGWRWAPSRRHTGPPPLPRKRAYAMSGETAGYGREPRWRAAGEGVVVSTWSSFSGTRREMPWCRRSGRRGSRARCVTVGGLSLLRRGRRATFRGVIRRGVPPRNPRRLGDVSRRPHR